MGRFEHNRLCRRQHFAHRSVSLFCYGTSQQRPDAIRRAHFVLETCNAAPKRGSKDSSLLNEERNDNEVDTNAWGTSPGRGDGSVEKAMSTEKLLQKFRFLTSNAPLMVSREQIPKSATSFD